MINQEKNVSISHELKQSYLAYAMSVIVGRALPDVRDGLKPVHRRILYAMHEMGNTHQHAYKKSARVVGNVIGKYHPHVDSAVYDAMVRMAQDFSMRLPLVDGQGNFGSIDGDPPAAMRYTEVRMAKACEDLLTDIDKDTVAFQPNYDGSEREPQVLPARLPNLLINGSNGIAVGMSTSIPPHRPEEIIKALIFLMRNPNASLFDLLSIIPGPDFPTGGIIYGRQEIFKAYKTGKGILKVRAKTHVEQAKNRGRTKIIVTELPYQVNKTKLLEKTAQLVREKKIQGIAAIQDESDRHGMRVVFELKRDANPDVLLNQLYKLTDLQSSFGITLLAIVGGKPQILTLKDSLQHFIEFRREIVLRRSLFKLNKAQERSHLLQGLLKAIQNIDDILQTIRKSSAKKEARLALIQKYQFSERQAQAILDMQLHRLTSMEYEKIHTEYQTIQREISGLQILIRDPQQLDQTVVEEFEALLKIYSDPRRTEIIEASGEITLEDLISDEEMVITITHQNYVKRVPLQNYPIQRRGGRGLRGVKTKEDDAIKDIFIATSKTSLLIITTRGRAFSIKVYHLPLRDRAQRGKPMIQFLPHLDKDEAIATILPIPKQFSESRQLAMATQNGLIKLTPMMPFMKIRRSGIRAIHLLEGDSIIGAAWVQDHQTILLTTQNGQTIHFHSKDIRITGRTSRGVRGIRLSPGDRVVSMTIPQDQKGKILLITDKGYGKRSPISLFRIQKRGGKGIKSMRLSEKNGKIIDAIYTYDGDQFILITSKGLILRSSVDQIRTTSRYTMGVHIIKLLDDERLIACNRFKDLSTQSEHEGDKPTPYS